MEFLIRFGVLLTAVSQDPAKGDYTIARRAAIECERLGFNSVWLNDHFFPFPSPMEPWLECWTTLSALAVETKNLRLGTLVSCNSFRYPSVLAKMGATLDVISEGRLELGLGAGWHKAEYIAYGVPFPKSRIRIEQLREGVRIIRKMWTQERATYYGKYYSIKEAFCNPKPVQSPHPPIWICGRSSHVLRVAAEFADGCNFYACSPNECGENVKILNQHCMKIGRDPSEIQKSWLGTVLIGKNKLELANKIEKFKLQHPRKEVREMALEEYKSRHIVGTPEQCVDKIRELVDFGITYLVVVFPDMGDLHVLKLFSDHVIAGFR